MANSARFHDPRVTAKGEPRARIALKALRVLWFNTGSLCNLTCANCYMESSPRNDALAYLGLDDVTAFLDEISAASLPTEEIGFTGGEPFLNPHIVPMLATCLERGFRILVLTNAMKPMRKLEAPLLALCRRFGDRLALRVSLDHFGATLHELERGPHAWEAALAGLGWLAANGFNVRVAGRTRWGQPEAALRDGYARLLAERNIALSDAEILLFPEMDAASDVPEIGERCWGILGVSPDAMMCASSRMVVKRKGAERAVVVACTLLPFDARFELGASLSEACGPIPLNHPHCARFCVLGGGSCSRSG